MHPEYNRFEEAARWALKQPNLHQMMMDCYVTYETFDDALRFYSSAEFSETLSILTNLGKGPGRGFSLLDFGCGNGIASFAFSRAGYLVTATDLCHGEIAGIEAARSLIGKDNQHFEIYEGNILESPIEHKYDVVYCRQVLHHLKPLNGELLKYLCDVLTPGGCFCAMREQVIWSESQRNRLKEEHPLNHITQDEEGFYLSEYLGALTEHGLRVVQTLWPYDSVVNMNAEDLKHLQARVYRRLPVLGSLLWRYRKSRKLVLRAMAFLFRKQPPWQVFSFIAVKSAS